MNIRDVMIHDVHSLGPGTSLGEAEAEMKARGLELMPVVSNGGVEGMVTARLVRDLAASRGLAAGTVLVTEAMVPAATCRESDSIEDARRAIQENPAELPGVIVLDQAGNLAGIALTRDLEEGTLDLPPLTGAYGAAEPKAGIDIDPVDHRSEESFPASDSPPPPSTISPQSPDEGPIRVKPD